MNIMKCMNIIMNNEEKMDKKQLEADFHHAMLEIYDLAKKLPTPYRATRFKQW